MKNSRRLVTALSTAAVVIGSILAAPTWASAATHQGAASAHVKKPTCTDEFTGGGGTSNFWGTAANWQHGVPGSSDFACIPSSITEQVIFNQGGTTPIWGLSTTNKGGLFLHSGGLEITKDPSTVKDVSFLNGGFQVDADITLSLTGTKGSLAGATIDGSGTVRIPKGSTIDGSDQDPGGIGNALTIDNQGTFKQSGYGISTPAEFDNRGTLSMTGGGGTSPAGALEGTTFINSGHVIVSQGKDTGNANAGILTSSVSNSGTITLGDNTSLNLGNTGVPFTNTGQLVIASTASVSTENAISFVSPSSSLGLTLTEANDGYVFIGNYSNMALGGSLAISLGRGFLPKLGQEWAVTDGNVPTGNFSSETVNNQSGLCVPGDSGIALQSQPPKDVGGNEVVYLAAVSNGSCP